MKNKQNEYKNRITDTNHITMTPFLSQKIKLLSLIKYYTCVIYPLWIP